MPDDFEAIKFATLCRMVGGHPQFLRYIDSHGNAHAIIRCYDGKPMSPDSREFVISKRLYALLGSESDWYYINKEYRDQVETAYRLLTLKGHKKEVVV